MATIDPSIAMGYKPIQVENPMNQMAALSQVQNAQNQNALAQYQLSAAQRADEATNIQNQLYAKHYDPTTGKVNTQGLYGDLAKSPVTAGLIPKLQAQFTELEHKANINRKVVTETEGLTFKQKIDKQNKALAAIAALDTPAAALADINKHLADGEIDQNQADKLRASIAQAPSFRDWQKSTLLNVLDAKDRLVTSETERANLAREKNAAEQLGVSKGQLGVSQQRLGLEQNKALREQTMGTIPAGYRLSADGTSLEPIPGGPTTVPLAPKELQAREAKFPQATQALKTFDSAADNLISDLERLKNHPGLSNITGVIAGRTPSLTAQGREAQALYKKIIARGGFQELQNLRQSSPTGGALGNVSNQENQSLREAFGALDQTQDASSVRNEIDRIVTNIGGSKNRVREAFDMTYDYKNTAPRSNAAPPAAPNQTKSGATVSNW